MQKANVMNQGVRVRETNSSKAGDKNLTGELMKG